MTMPTVAPPRLAPGAAVEVCRLTVKTPDRRIDLALPVSAAIGEVLPLVVTGGLRPGADEAAWVLQRLGGPPLDPGASPESLGLHDGEVLYVNRADQMLPEADFDDVTVGVAQVVAARPDHWRPEFTRYLLFAAGLVAVAGFAFAANSARPHWLVPLWYGAAAAGLTVWGVIAHRVIKDRISGLITGAAACVLGALTGLAARHADAGLFTLDRQSVILLGIGVAVPALVLVSVGRLPTAAFGAVAALGIAAAVGGGLAAGLRWNAVRVAALLAVLVFAAAATELRLVLRATKLRVPLLPRTAEELQEDIDPQSQDVIRQRTDQAVSLLNMLFLTASVLTVVAGYLLAFWPGWIGWLLASVLAAAMLLRARALTMAWQRTPLVLAGLACAAFVAVARISGAGSAARSLVLVGLLVAAAALLAASRLMPGRRMLPVWGHTADLLEIWTAIALVPLLLQLFHVFAYFRGLIH
jgi:type VII secretion integral membrane protein EccD